MSDAPSLEPPLRLKDRYQLVEWRGEGGMATVYRAHDETLDRDVAIKFFAPGRVVGQEASARFLREARAVARLSHPNIMALYDVDREGLWHYLVLEHIPGRDLHALMVERGGPLPLHEALHAMRGVLAALAYAHGQGLVHRDIKPENVMVTPSGAVKVADFGLALAQGDMRLTQEDTIVGTLLYLAPEAISGGRLDHRADLYAVGAVLYELLTGQPPFVGDHSLGVISQILHQPLTPPRRLDPRIPAAVEEVVVRLLARDPASRYASAEEALAALPDPAEADSLAAEEAADEGEAGREPLSLLERLVRSSSAALQRPEAEVVADGAPAESLAAEALLVYAAREDTAAAVEAERRRLARLLQGNVAEAINLLLSQASAYEQTLGGNPQARMAVSVLTTLARQLLQQVRDLEATLHPTVLETLGLEPALEALASQATRAHGLHVNLGVARLDRRLPAQMELALFRAAQDALERAVRQAQASQVTIRLARQGEELLFGLSDNGVPHLGAEVLRAARQRLEQLGGTVKTGVSADGGLDLTVHFRLEAPAALTPREMDVLQLLAEGLSNKQIAGALYISPSTVNFHLENIYSKLGVNSRTEAAIYALRHGLVRRPSGYS